MFTTVFYICICVLLINSIALMASKLFAVGLGFFVGTIFSASIVMLLVDSNGKYNPVWRKKKKCCS
jgi:Na+/glutamate symporter